MMRSILAKLGLLAENEPAVVDELAETAIAAKKMGITVFEGETAAGSRMCGLRDAVLAGWYNSETGELLEGFVISAEDTVLDVGCGEGAATLFSARQGAHVVFSDLERDKIEELEEKVAQSPARKYEALVCDTNPLPVADAYASRVVAMEMLEHTERPDLILQELVRVGKPGALYLLTVPDPEAEKLQQGIAPDQYYQAPNHVRIFEREEFERTVSDAGLEIVRRSTMGFYWTMWMFFFWVTEAAAGREFDGAVLDKIKPPYHPLMESWSSTWHQLLQIPQGQELKRKMDDFLPKTQVIIARKPV
ncbi:MAG: class I SAM-dependent methyltransferase [bacterium]